MTKKKHAARVALQAAARALSDEVWEGRWDHIASLKTRPIAELEEIFDELERRCPGHTRQEYQDAFARRFTTGR